MRTSIHCHTSEEGTIGSGVRGGVGLGVATVTETCIVFPWTEAKTTLLDLIWNQDQNIGTGCGEESSEGN